MTAFLTVDILRAHAALMPWRTRAVLRAHWLVAADGRLTCLWRADDPGPATAPPH